MIEEKDLNGEELIKEIKELLNNEKKYNEIKTNLKKISINNSSEIIYNSIKELIK